MKAMRGLPVFVLALSAVLLAACAVPRDTPTPAHAIDPTATSATGGAISTLPGTVTRSATATSEPTVVVAPAPVETQGTMLESTVAIAAARSDGAGPGTGARRTVAGCHHYRFLWTGPGDRLGRADA